LLTGSFRAKALFAIYLVTNSGFPWLPRSGGADAGQRFRRVARRAILARWPVGLRPLAVLGATLAWPLASFLEALQMSRCVLADRLEQRSRVGSFWWAWRLALRHNVPPVEAFAYRLYEPNSTHPDQWWYTLEATSLVRHLTDSVALKLASDKGTFAEWCSDNGLRHIPTLALAAADAWVRPFGGDGPPPRDLLLKPCLGSQGRGVEGWRFKADGCYWSQGRRLHADEFAAYVLHRASAEGPMLVQPMLSPHPTLRVMAGTGMPAARVITGRWPDGRVELGPGLLQAPLPGEFVSQSGPFRLIEPMTGKVSAATPRQEAPVFDIALGEGFDGLVLPGWKDAAGLLARAHSIFPGQAPIIGWDLLFDDEGPLICEANIEISYYFFQQAGAQPMASTSLARLVEAWL